MHWEGWQCPKWGSVGVAQFMGTVIHLHSYSYPEDLSQSSSCRLSTSSIRPSRKTVSTISDTFLLGPAVFWWLVVSLTWVDDDDSFTIVEMLEKCFVVWCLTTSIVWQFSKPWLVHVPPNKITFHPQCCCGLLGTCSKFQWQMSARSSFTVSSLIMTRSRCTDTVCAALHSLGSKGTTPDSSLVFHYKCNRQPRDSGSSHRLHVQGLDQVVRSR